VAESSWPTVAGSRIVTDDQWELLSIGFGVDGVLGLPTDSSVVYGDASGRQVKVRAGKIGHIGGHGWASGTSDVVKTIGANSSGSTRIDLIVLRLTRSTLAVTAEVVAGTPGAGVPALTRNARGAGTGVWEIPLAQVTVVNGAATISAGDVTDIAWYSHGNTVTTSSTSGVQPPATDYPRLRHYNTGYEYDSLHGLWRRGPWGVARGMVGGRRYQSGGTLASGITSESLSGMSSGSITLEANRRYRVTGSARLTASANDTAIYLRVRETNVSGTVVAFYTQLIRGFGGAVDWQFQNEFNNLSATTKSYVVTVQANFAVTVSGGSSSLPTGVWLEDIGPVTSPDLISIV
jgi:hypothetical protein